MYAARVTSLVLIAGLLQALLSVQSSQQAASGLTIRPQQLECEYQKHPLAVQTRHPRFSWVLAAEKPAERGLAQSKFRLLVATSSALLDKDRPDVWDTGEVQSSSTIQIVYQGRPLVSGAEYFWRVVVWQGEKKKAVRSETAAFRMGLLNPQDWKAHWIAARPDIAGAGQATAGPLPIFRRSFHLSKKTRDAVVYVSGLGQYELRLNRLKIGQSELTPGWTNYRKTVFYNTYDVTQQLKEGVNVVDVELGNGMYNVQPTKGRYTKLVESFGQPKLIFQLQIRNADGTSEVIGSDNGWESRSGPIRFSQPYGGEDFDARLEPAGLDSESSDIDRENWKSSVAVSGPGGALVSQTNPDIRVMHIYQPVRVSEPKPGTRVYDLGQNFAGWPAIQVRGPRGSAVRLTPGELVDGSGEVTQRSSGGPQWFSYTLKGTGREEWHPRFSYYGFRYVQAETIPAAGSSVKPELLSLEGQFVHSSAQITGTFECSKPLFNRIHALINAALESNMQSVLTDCPHREKLGWLEETHLLGSAIMYGYDVARLYEKISDDIHDAQIGTGLVPAIAPEYVVFPPPFRDSPEWGSAVVLDPWIAYQHYGDEQNLAAHYEDMKRYVTYLGSKAKGGILAYGLGDWYDIGPGEPSYSKLTSLGVTATATYYQYLVTISKIAKILNKQDDAESFAALGRTIRSAFNARFYQRQTGVYDRGSQTDYAMPLVTGLVPEEDRHTVLDKLVADVRQHQNHVTAGDIGFHYVVSALLDGGRSDVLFDMLSKTDSPSYGYQLAKGATTLTEAWDSNPKSSQNHFMLGHAEEWFYRGLAGIDFDLSRARGDQIRIKPTPAGDVTEASATYDSVLGRIASRWSRNAKRMTLRVEIPPNSQALICVPNLSQHHVAEMGRHAGEKKVSRVGLAGDFTVFRVESGEFQFVSE